MDVRCQICSNRRWRRGIANNEAADSGRDSPFGGTARGMGVASIAGSNRLRWNRVSIAKPLVIGWQESLLAFSGRAFPLGSIPFPLPGPLAFRSEEHPSELQSLMRISYAVFCLKKKKYKTDLNN